MWGVMSVVLLFCFGVNVMIVELMGGKRRVGTDEMTVGKRGGVGGGYIID